MKEISLISCPGHSLISCTSSSDWFVWRATKGGFCVCFRRLGSGSAADDISRSMTSPGHRPGTMESLWSFPIGWTSTCSLEGGQWVSHYPQHVVRRVTYSFWSTCCSTTNHKVFSAPQPALTLKHVRKSILPPDYSWNTVVGNTPIYKVFEFSALSCR